MEKKSSEIFQLSQPIQSVSSTASKQEALSLMENLKAQHLPVTRDGQIVGILSARDFESPLESLSSFSRPFLTIDESETLGKAAQSLSKSRDSALLVTRQEKPVGIVTTTDLLRVLVKILETGVTANASPNSTAGEGKISGSQFSLAQLATPLSLVLEELSLSGI